MSKNFRSPPSISSSPPLVILNELSFSDLTYSRFVRSLSFALVIVFCVEMTDWFASLCGSVWIV